MREYITYDLLTYKHKQEKKCTLRYALLVLSFSHGPWEKRREWAQRKVHFFSCFCLDYDKDYGLY